MPASLPRPTHRFLPGLPPAGWEALPGLPRPQAHSHPLGDGSYPSCIPHPLSQPSQEWAFWGVLAGGHCPSVTPAWPGLVLPTCQQLQLPSWAGRGMGREGKARRAWTGQSPHPQPSSGRKGQREVFSSWNMGAKLSGSTWAIGVPSLILSFLFHKMGGKYILPAGEINETRS